MVARRGTEASRSTQGFWSIIGLLGLGGALFLGGLSSVQAGDLKRYVMVVKDPSLYTRTQQQLALQSRQNLGMVKFAGAQGIVQPFGNVDVEVAHSLNHIRSFVIETSDEAQIAALQKTNMGIAVEPEFFYPAPAPVAGFTLTRPWDYVAGFGAAPLGLPVVGPATPWGIGSVKAPQAWSQGEVGLRARVLVLDTGIDRDHPALRDNFEIGKNFVGDFNLPYDVADQVGHGTHVAGTIAAVANANGFVGVAPQARILMGRVCSDMGCSNIAVARGIDWGIEKKVDVISMSLGGPKPSQVQQVAVEAAEAAGIVVVAASGNDGKAAVSFPAAHPTVVAVGAIDSQLKKAKFSNWGPELDVVAPGVSVVSSVPMGTGREPVTSMMIAGQQEQNLAAAVFEGSADVPREIQGNLVHAGLGKPEDVKSTKLQGQFALIKRGEIPFVDKVKNAMGAGASGVIFYNNEPGLGSAALTDDGSKLAIPVLMIENTPGEVAAKALKAGNAVSMKLQVRVTDYANFNGTSMATPHVAGVLALIRSANKTLKPAQVRELIKQNVTPLELIPENQLGAGLINAEKAVATAQKSR